MMSAVTKLQEEVSVQILDFPGGLAPLLPAARIFANEFVSLPERPSAIYAYSDDYALLLMRAFREAGFRIPGDVAILGTDDIPYGELHTPTLSTIRFDAAALGERAVALINFLITDTC
ncbi:MAG: substrate-binding domain-containing protein [Treponema sp.]|jgi:LacI family transcriptional regulator|nr:substrate-binding domain-containing protein [Treponema sp.]